MSVITTDQPAASRRNANEHELALMPWPAEVQRLAGRFVLTASFSATAPGPHHPWVQAAIGRMLRRWERRSGLSFSGGPSRPLLLVACERTGAARPALGEDESYALDVAAGRIELRAPTSIGALRGLATLEQLLARDGEGWFVPAVTIRDRPRFPWRGLMIDVVRHWISAATIMRQLDAMALVKLNVLHLHLTDDQGFRIESRGHPRLHECGADGKFFTRAQMREIIANAAARGIRVVPEFDVPGHATSWLAGYPELASAPGNYSVERHWGVHDAVLDPTNEQVYTLLQDFLGEMAELFPDEFVHIGGDENNGKQWSANAGIQTFVCERGLGDNAGLQAYFNRRVQAMLGRRGKRLVGWDEILHQELPRDSVVQSWRGADSLADAARRGFGGILSRGFYLDHCQPAAWHYAMDPLPPSVTLTAEEQRRVLGGEAAMWTEWVSEEMLDGRIWPRAAAIAERLWSPRDVNDIPDMYSRLEIVGGRLEETGLTQERKAAEMLRRLAGAQADEGELGALRALVGATEPVANYRRSRMQRDHTQATPLSGLADCARPDSAAAREFSGQVEKFLVAPEEDKAGPRVALVSALRIWREAAGRLRSASASEVASVAAVLHRVCAIGLEALRQMETKTVVAEHWREEALGALTRAAQTPVPVDLAIIGPVRLLVAAAATQREGVPPAAWRTRVEAAAELGEFAARNLPPPPPT